MRGDKECPFSGVTKSGRVWRKLPESDARSLREREYVPLVEFQHTCQLSVTVSGSGEVPYVLTLGMCSGPTSMLSGPTSLLSGPSRVAGYRQSLSLPTPARVFVPASTSSETTRH